MTEKGITVRYNMRADDWIEMLQIHVRGIKMDYEARNQELEDITRVFISLVDAIAQANKLTTMKRQGELLLNLTEALTECVFTDEFHQTSIPGPSLKGIHRASSDLSIKVIYAHKTVARRTSE